MHVFQKILKTQFINLILFSLFLIHFWKPLQLLARSFSQVAYFEHTLAFVSIVAIGIFTAIKNKPWQDGSKNILSCAFLSAVLLFYSFNAFIFKFSSTLIPSILFLLGTYSLLGFFLKPAFWIRSSFIVLMLILTLPTFLERLQQFVGFPIRFFTADAVSFLLNIMGIGNLSRSTVVMLENRATSIDLPCSGVKSIYTGALFFLTVCYINQARISKKLVGISLTFFLILLLFNVWRVFSIIYIYDILKMQQFGDVAHVALGIVGFLVSCTWLWYQLKEFPSDHISLEKRVTTSDRLRFNTKYLAIILLCGAILLHLRLKQNTIQNTAVSLQYEFHLPSIQLTEVPFTVGETSYFINSAISYSKKFSGETKSGVPFSLLIVVSASAKTHHDPEICLQGLGYSITDSKILEIEGIRVRQLRLNDGASVIYWYVGKDKNLLEYSERVWEEMSNPGKSWALIILGFNEIPNLERQELQELISDTHHEVKNLVQ